MSGTGIIVTLQELKIVSKLHYILRYKREKFGSERSWVYPSELIAVLPDVKSRSIRSFLDKLEKMKIIENIPVIPSAGTDWGGVFRFTKEGEKIVQDELDSLPIQYSENTTSR